MTGKKDNALIATFMLAILLIVAILLLNEKLPPLVAISTSTPTNTFIGTSTNTSPFPSPMVGPVIINGPSLFSIQGWNDDDAQCGLTVTIYGVTISHGKPPYTFTFWSQKEPYTSQVVEIKQVIALENSRDYVEFVSPVVVAKGSYKHVELTFQQGDSKQVTWIDDLFYPAPNNCLETEPSETPVPMTQMATPNATQILKAAYNEVDKQFQESLKSNIAFVAPETMELDETVIIELDLNPLLSQDELETQILEQSDFLTSTANPNQLLTERGGNVAVVTDEIFITDRMKAVIKSRKQSAFEIQELHDSAEQPISSVDTTKWRWSVAAKEQGEQTLDLVLYRLVKYDGDEYWREVETYRADIDIKVTTSQWLKLLDWKWILGIFATALLIPLFFRWFDNRKKKDGEQKESKPSKKKHRTN